MISPISHLVPALRMLGVPSPNLAGTPGDFFGREVRPERLLESLAHDHRPRFSRFNHYRSEIARMSGGALIPYLRWHRDFYQRTHDLDNPYQCSKAQIYLLYFLLHQKNQSFYAEDQTLKDLNIHPLPDGEGSLFEWQFHTHQLAPKELSYEDLRILRNRWLCRVGSDLITSISRHLAMMENTLFNHHRRWIERLFPEVLHYRQGLISSLPREEIEKEMRYEGGTPRNTLFYTPWPSLAEIGLVQTALDAAGRDGKVYIYSKEEFVRKRYEAAFRDPRLVTLGDYYSSDHSSELRRNKVDRIFVLYPAHYNAFIEASYVLREGGKIVFQYLDIYDVSSQPSFDFRVYFPSLRDSLEQIIFLRNVSAIIKTSFGEVFPSGNMFLIARKKK